MTERSWDCSAAFRSPRCARSRGSDGALLALGIGCWAQGDFGRATAVLCDSLRLKESLEDQLGGAMCYETLAWASAGLKEDQRAATMLGIADTAWKYAGTTMDGFVGFSTGHAASVTELRKTLGDRSFTLLRRKGAAMPATAAMASALGDQVKAAPAQAAGIDFSPITRREWQVAQAVAEGLSNRQLAARFVIAQRTAEGHVEHILTKLGFTSRAQIAAWVAERRAGAQADFS